MDLKGGSEKGFFTGAQKKKYIRPTKISNVFPLTSVFLKVCGNSVTVVRSLS